jgi:hypothetical protein
VPPVYFDGENAHCGDGFWPIRESVILGFGEHLEGVQLCQAVVFFVIGLIPKGASGLPAINAFLSVDGGDLD